MNAPLALYIHWPFCLSKCPYCDFNSHVRDQVSHSAWQTALLKELRYYASQLSDRQLVSIFFGGGTPSLMQPSLVQTLIDTAISLWPAADDLEITLEANPTSVETAKLAEFLTAGITRISMGVQALDDEALGFLGREHTVNEALHAFDSAASLFERTSFDLIYARPKQSLSAWERELRQALRHAQSHLSLYQLTIEPGTQFFHKVQSGALTMPDNDHLAALYTLTQSIMEGAGLPAYEISNHARPGDECRHNLTYWHYQDYVGIGPGAHGRITCDGHSFATQAIRSPEKWLQAVSEQGHGTESRTALVLEDIRAELLLMGLRTKDGISRNYYQRRTGETLDALLRHGYMQTLFAEAFLEMTDTHLRATAKGWMVLDTLTSKVLDALTPELAEAS